MPFKSKSQQRFMFAKHPKMAEEFASVTPSISKLPEHVNKMAEGGEVQAPQNAEEWDRIKHFVGGSANQGAQHPLAQEAERARRRQPQNFDEGGMAVDPRGTDYNAQASDAMGGITPDVINRLSQSLNQNQRQGQIGAGIAGIGDAIASVGGQHPGHMQAAEEAIQQNRQNAMQVPGQMAAMGKERFGISQTLQEQDPNSPLSKALQKGYAPLGKRMGIDLSGASAKMIGDLTGKSVEQLKNEAQEAEARALHEQTGVYQQGMLQNTRENQQAQRSLEGEKIKEGAQEKLANQGILKRFGNWATGNPGQKMLQSTATGGTPAPHGELVKQNGVTYRWNGSSYEAE